MLQNKSLVEKGLNKMAQRDLKLLQVEGLQQLIPSTSVQINDKAKRRAIEDREQISNAVSTSLTKKFEESRSLKSLQVLEALWIQTSKERFTLAFDYFSMHERCTRLLRAINSEFAKEILEMNGGEVKKEEGMLPMVPYLVFRMMEEGGEVGVEDGGCGEVGGTDGAACGGRGGCGDSGCGFVGGGVMTAKRMCNDR